MDNDNRKSQREQIQKALEAIPALRGTLDDSIIDTTIKVLRKQLAELETDLEVKQQRKQVTILFMDVVNSTHLMEKLDPEDNLAIMDNALQSLAQPIKAHGGKVTRYMGDGFLAVFGLPKSQENDPEMAVRAGLKIIETAQEIAKSLETKYQIAGFQVRIGVNTGLVVAGGETEAEDTIMGAPVNLASRLEQAAPPDGLLISQHTYQFVQGVFELRHAKSINAKGFSEPIQIYQVLKAKPHAYRVKSRGVEGIETQMVGREKELKILQNSIEFVIKNHKHEFITIAGEAGVGKSRLLDEFENWLKEHKIPTLLLKGRATLESLDLPYSLLRDIFIPLFKILDNDTLSVVRDKITNYFKETMGEEIEYEMRSHFVGQFLGYDFRDSPFLQGILKTPQQLRDRALVYLNDLIKRHAAHSPIIIFLDDIHWADESSLDILCRMSDELSDQPLMIVALTRHSLFDRKPSWGTGPQCRGIDLKSLSQHESERLLAQILHKIPEIPEQLPRIIFRNAEGNPFYIEELVKMFVEEGVIIKSEPIWSVQPGWLHEMNIPPTLTGVIQARLDRLPVFKRTTLQQASVVGKTFWDEAVLYIKQKIQPEDVSIKLKSIEIEEYLNDLQDREMIFRQAESAFSDAVEYNFKNAVFQEVTYQSLLKRTRRLYHAVVADWLIAHGGERVGEISGLIASHLEIAEKNEEALNYLCLAAKIAETNYAIDEAADFYTRAIALTPEEDLEKRYSLLMGLDKIFRFQGNRDEQRNTLNALEKIVNILADENKRSELLIRKAWFAFWTSNYPEGLSLAHQAVAISKTLDDSSLSMQAYYVLSWMLLQNGDTEKSLEQARTALSIARQTDDIQGRGNILNIMGLINISRGDFFASLDFLKEFLSIARQVGDLNREITARNNLGVAFTSLGDYSSARENYQESLKIAQEGGDWNSVATGYINLGWVTTAQGEWELAREYSEIGIAKKREQEHFHAVAEGLVWYGHAWLGLNEPEKAISAYNESLTIQQELNQPHLVMELMASLARAALAQKDLQTALEHTNKILAYLDDENSLQQTWEPLRIYLTCYQVLTLAGDIRAEKFLATAYNLLQEQASRISDPMYRKFFMEKVPWHHKIMDEWQNKNGEK